MRPCDHETLQSRSHSLIGILVCLTSLSPSSPVISIPRSHTTSWFLLISVVLLPVKPPSLSWETACITNTMCPKDKQQFTDRKPLILSFMHHLISLYCLVVYYLSAFFALTFALSFRNLITHSLCNRMHHDSHVSYLCFLTTIEARMTPSLRITRLNVPKAVENGSSLFLSCFFDLNGETLYSVKWYRDYVEFFRFLPSNAPTAAQTIRLKGAYVDVSTLE